MNPLFTLGKGQLPKLKLEHANGSSAEIYQHGAHVTSWITADGKEQFFLSETAFFKAATPIRGGVPIVFPQFGNFGPLPMHGFVRTENWECVEATKTEAIFKFTQTPATLSIWPHRFELNYRVVLGEKSLELHLSIKNTDTQPFDFHNSLHTYLRVNNINHVEIHGYQGTAFNDRLTNINGTRQTSSVITFTKETDLIYHQAPSEVTLIEEGRKLHIQQKGFPDAVIFNPWIKKGQSMADLEPDGYLRMACVEAALIEKKFVLEPGKVWEGSQSFSL
jgi:glucose-6-phosphate 1-epimerase